MFKRAITAVAAEQTIPWVNKIASKIPKVGPAPRLIVPPEPTLVMMPAASEHGTRGLSGVA